MPSGVDQVVVGCRGRSVGQRAGLALQVLVIEDVERANAFPALGSDPRVITEFTAWAAWSLDRLDRSTTSLRWRTLTAAALLANAHRAIARVARHDACC